MIPCDPQFDYVVDQQGNPTPAPAGWEKTMHVVYDDHGKAEAALRALRLSERKPVADVAYQEVREGAETVRLYETKILKDAQDNMEAARPAYVTGLIPASNLVEAERTFVELKDRYFQAVADYFHRQAALDRAVGEPTGPGTSAQSPRP